MLTGLFCLTCMSFPHSLAWADGDKGDHKADDHGAGHADDHSAGHADDQVASLYSDFLHYARIGKFTEAEANAAKLLSMDDLDPVQLMNLSNDDRESVPRYSR